MSILQGHGSKDRTGIERRKYDIDYKFLNIIYCIFHFPIYNTSSQKGIRCPYSELINFLRKREFVLFIKVIRAFFGNRLWRRKWLERESLCFVIDIRK